MFLNDPLSTARPAGGRPALVGVVCSAVLVLLLGLAPRPMFEFLMRGEPIATVPAAASTLPADPAGNGDS